MQHTNSNAARMHCIGPPLIHTHTRQLCCRHRTELSVSAGGASAPPSVSALARRGGLDRASAGAGACAKAEADARAIMQECGRKVA